MISKEDFDQAAAVIKYLGDKKKGTVQDTLDYHANVSICLIYRIQELEHKVKALEEMFILTPP